MNATPVLRTFTDERKVLWCLHADGGITALKGMPPNHETVHDYSHAGWNALTDGLVPLPIMDPHDGIAWMEQEYKAGGPALA